MSQDELSLRRYTFVQFSIVELDALYRLLSHHYIPYGDEEALHVVKKIAQSIEEYELGSRDSQSPQRT